MRNLKEEIEAFKYFDQDLNQLMDSALIEWAGLEKNLEAMYAFEREKAIVRKLLAIENYLNIKSEFYKKRFKENNICEYAIFKRKDFALSPFINNSEFSLYLNVFKELFEMK